MRILYSLLLYLLLPSVLLRLWWKGRCLPAYRQHWSERLGTGVPQGKGAIWVHAVSVGEVRAAAVLVEALMEFYPDKPMVITTSTPTGRQTIVQLFGDTVECQYLPYDLPGATRRFSDALQPCVAIFMEVELWPNLYAALSDRHIPIYLANARLSPASFEGYRKLGSLMRRTLAKIDRIAAQTAADKQRFEQLGVEAARVSVAGNLKFDAKFPRDFSARLRELAELTGADRTVWVAGSTHAGEETLILSAHRALLSSLPDALLIIAPRHPERAKEVAGLCNEAGLDCQVFSKAARIDVQTRVLIIDRMGVLIYLYGIAKAAFIGGSLVDIGGHNPVEAILAGVPVISGRYDGNFAEIYTRLRDAGAARQILSADELSKTLVELFSNHAVYDRQVGAAHRIVDENRGSLDRMLAQLTLLKRQTAAV